MFPRMIFPLWLLAFLAIGSGARAGEDVKAAKAQADQGAKGVPNATRAPETTVKLLDPGAEPRKELRYRFQAGRSRSMALESSSSMGMEMFGAAQPETKMPASRNVITVTEKLISPQGDLSYEFKVESVEVMAVEGGNPFMVDAMKGAMKSLEGVSGTGMVTPRGISSEADVKLPPNVNSQARQSVDSLRQTMRQLWIPLPTEPVGKGARWEVRMPFSSAAMKFDQDAQVTLLEVNGDQLKLSVDLKQSAKEQEINQAGMPAGMKIKLSSMSGTGTGQCEVNLGLLGTRSSFKLTSSSDMETSGGPGGQAMKMKMTMKNESKTSPVELTNEKKVPAEKTSTEKK